ncbi:MAG TPA: HAD family hydrolase [Pseudonocardiaceae bacterium]|nr:HAD family hydrolase [Pseudonocardiaceae bacterium]
MTIRGVLFDFSGTLFRLEFTDPGLPHDDESVRVQRIMLSMTAAIGPREPLPIHDHPDWARRDLDPDIHRRVYTEAFRQAGITEALVEPAYRRVLDPVSWTSYPDTEAALRRLHDADVPVAVVSNIAWDIRPIFDQAGITDLVTEFTLSYVEGSMKPDEKLFRVACDRLGVEPADALMIGDSVAADGGAATLGCAVEIVPPIPTGERPDALLSALAKHGL